MAGTGEIARAGDAVSSRRIGSLCSGIGGLDLAVEEHFGAELAWYAEPAEAPWWVMQQHWPDAPNHGSIIENDWNRVEPVDILTAGYPCQPVSHAGKRQGADDERYLWPYVYDAIRDLRPGLVVLENVRGHLSLGFDAVLGDLAEAGFDAEWCLLRASDVGAPHQRARLWIVARDTDRAPTNPRAAAGASRPPVGERHRAAVDADHGRRIGRGSTEPTTEGHGWEGGQWRPARAGAVAPDPSGPRAGRDGRGVPRAAAEGGRADIHVRPAVDARTDAWGAYAPAIERWERTLGRPAPRPTDDERRLSPAFVEWMMGYPEGWVDGLTRTQALKALGNAVVPQQALAALDELAPDAARNGAAA